MQIIQRPNQIGRLITSFYESITIYKHSSQIANPQFPTISVPDKQVTHMVNP